MKTSEARINIPFHNLTKSEDRYHARKQAEAFLEYLSSTGDQDVTEISVTWTPQGSFGGILVTKRGGKNKTNKENVEPILETNKRGIKRKRNSTESLKIKIKLPIK